MTDLSPEDTAISRLRLYLLGSPRVVLDGRTVTGFKSVKVQALLFYVAVSQRPRSRAELAAMFWPEANNRQGGTSLRAALSNLRKLVGEYLEITRQTVSLKSGSNVSLDVVQFETLLKQDASEALDILQVETAVSLYEGDFLEGFHVPDTPLFEQWVTIEGTRLREAMLNSLQKLALWHADRSEYQTSLEYLTRLLALDPIRDVAHRLKMAVLAMSGQTGAALTHFDVSRRIRSEQLGLDPTPETSALYELILHDRFPMAELPALSEFIVVRLSRPIASPASTKGVDEAPFSRIRRRKKTNVDWGAMPSKVELYGRREQLSQLTQWLMSGDCRLVTILGIGGVGKTALAAEAARLLNRPVHDRFSDSHYTEGTGRDAGLPYDQIVWRSLVNTPPLTAILNDWLQVLSAQKPSELPETIEAKLNLLLEELKRQRCLMILDNAESILRNESTDGQGGPLLAAYHQLMQQVANNDHQSCLLLTSREIPEGVRRLAQTNPAIQMLQLEGLPSYAGAELLRFRGLESSAERLSSIVHRYSGNPLALKLVAETVRELFGGNVDEFLRDETLIFADIRDVLDQQFRQLSGLEQEILTWMAIEREPVSANALLDNLVYVPHRRLFLEALRSLQRKSMLERSSEPVESSTPDFALQNVIMEYLTSRIVESVCEELESSELTLLQRYSLVKAHAKEYVVHSQQRLLLQPIVHWLISRHGSSGAEDRLRDLLVSIRAGTPRTPGYAGANILHLLLEMGVDVSGYDFSDLAIWQADLRDTSLSNVSFRNSDLKGTLFRDTFGLIVAIAISPDGQLLAAGGSDGLVMLWGLTEYQPQHLLKGHVGFVSSLAFGRNSAFLVSASRDRTICLWDVHTGRLIRQMSGHNSSILSISISPDGNTLFSGSEDKTIGVWDIQSGHLQRQLTEKDALFSAIAVSPDGQILASGDQDGFVYIWSAASGALKMKIPGHNGKIQSVAFSPDGKALATASEDNQINLWKTEDGTHIGLLSGHDSWVLSIAFSPDGTGLVSGSADRTIRLWDVASGQTMRVLRDYDNWVTSVAYTPDGELVAGGSYDRRIRLWDARSGRLNHTLRGSLRLVNQVIFSPNGKLLASASFDKPVLLWDVQSGQLLQTLRGHTGSVRCLAFNANNRLLAGGSDDQMVHLWDTPSGLLQNNLEDHDGFVRTVAFTPDGQIMATGGASKLYLWEVPSCRLRMTLTGAELGLNLSVCFSPDSQLLAYSCTDHTIRLLDVTTGHVKKTLTGHEAPVELVRFSTDGSLLASTSEDRTVRVWQVGMKDHNNRIQALFQWFTSLTDLWNLAFSPDGRYVAAQLDDSTVGVWDSKDGQLCYHVEESLFGEGCLDFSRDGRLLITGSTDGTVALWDAASGELHHKLGRHEGSVLSLAVSSDGRHIASSSDDGTIRIWDSQTASCKRTLTPPGPYEGMDITGARGLTNAQVAALQALGAVRS